MKFDKIAVIAEREVALGFKLIGIRDSFLSEGEDAADMLAKFIDTKSYNLIMVSESIKKHMNPMLKRTADSSLSPLVVFIPLPGKEEESESVEALAKRVLGVDIAGLSK